MIPAHPHSPNFSFLARSHAALVMVAIQAEQYLPEDPVTALMKPRRFGELLVQQVAARTGVDATIEPRAELLARLPDFWLMSTPRRLR
jgi:type I restriction enzyme R subunit